MTRIKGLWQDPRSGIFYLRRKVRETLRPLFNCGELYFDFFMSQLLARKLQGAGKLSLKPDEKTGKTPHCRNESFARTTSRIYWEATAE